MIKGLTDKFVIRRAGKIRSGYKEEGTSRLHNTKNFLLHDSPQLIPLLGEEPTEIFFTVNSDDLEVVAPADLRWYTKSELMCLGDGEKAAFFGNGDVAHVTQQPHPKMAKSRERRCIHRLCPEYQSGDCGEHIFLNMVIPQYSMASYFTLDSTSINAVLNVTGALQSTAVYGGPQGQIFRLFKKEIEVPFLNPKTGQKSKSMRPVVHVDFVPFERYEEAYRDKVAPHDWAALLALRSRQVQFVAELPSASDSPTQLAGSASRVALPAPEVSDEDLVKERANHPTVLKLFKELATLRNKPLTDEAIFNTAKMVPNTEALIDWLKNTISSDKRKLAEFAKAEVKPDAVVAAVPGPVVQAAAAQPAQAQTGSMF